MKTRDPVLGPVEGVVARAIFDIVNGFFNRCRGASYLADVVRYNDATQQMQVIWLRLSSMPVTAQPLCRAVVDGVDSQA